MVPRPQWPRIAFRSVQTFAARHFWSLTLRACAFDVVKKKFQDGAIGAGLALATIRAASDHVISKGVTHGEFSWILEDNMRVRHVLESMGSRVYKTYRVYEKNL